MCALARMCDSVYACVSKRLHTHVPRMCMCRGGGEGRAQGERGKDGWQESKEVINGGNFKSKRACVSE